MVSNSTYILRDYQKEGVAAALYNFKHYRDPFLLVAATGAGKSLMIADICYQLNEPVCVIVPKNCSNRTTTKCSAMVLPTLPNIQLVLALKR